MVIGYLGIWLFLGPLYGRFILNGDFLTSFARTASLVLVLTLGIANIYVFAGIEGYETNGWLKSRFFDLISSGVSAEEMVRGIIGKTVSHYPPALVQPLLLGSSIAVLGLIFLVPVTALSLPFIWLLYLGIYGAYQLLGGFSSLAYITIPGTLLWYRGVRRNYEQRLAEQQGEPTGTTRSLIRMIVFLSLSVGVVIGPILVYLYAGIYLSSRVTLPLSEWQRIQLFGTGYVLFAAAGFLVGKILGWNARRSAPTRLKRLEAELDRLFTIRGYVLFGGN